MLDPTQQAILNIIAPAAIAFEGISMALLGGLYTVYAPLAMPDEKTGARLPILKPLRIAARFTLGFATLNAVTGIIAFGSIQWSSTTLYVLAIVLMGLQIVAAPLLGVLVLRLFR
jgi:hypothetical protein